MLSAATSWLRSAFADLTGASTTTDANQGTVVLDPLSTLVRICSLHYKPVGTKLYLEQHALCFDSPLFYQGVSRCQRGASRQDIAVLKHTIQQAIQWYDFSHESIRYLAQGAIQGLHKFALCYNRTSNLALHSIEYYVLLLQTELNRTAEEADVEAKTSESYKDKPVLPPFIRAPSSEDFGLMSLWTEQQLRIVYAIFVELETQQQQGLSSEVDALIESIENILRSKDRRVRELIAVKTASSPGVKEAGTSSEAKRDSQTTG